MYTKTKAKGNIPFIIVLISVVLAFCILIGTVSAWLTKDYNPHSEDNQIGEVKVELYHDGSKITGSYSEEGGVSRWECNTPYVINGTGEIKTLNLTMRNNGTINCLVRATVAIYFIDSNNNHCPLIIVSDTPSGGNTCKLDAPSWVYDMAANSEGNGGVTGGYMYYNQQLPPYTYKEITSDIPGEEITEVTVPANEKSILNSIRVSSDLSDTTLYVKVTLEAIAYSGNIYKKLENGEITLDNTKYSALPFGLKEKLPSSWTAWA